MTSTFPGAIDSFTTKVDGIDDIMADHVNDLQDAIEAIEGELGTLPKGPAASVKALLEALMTGWVPDSDTWVYVSATSFKIVGKDIRSRFPEGTKLKCTNSTVKYFYVTSTSFSTDTTVNVTGGVSYSLSNAAISSNSYSYSQVSSGFPDGFKYFPLFVPLTAPLTSSAWDGDSFSTTAKTLIDLSAVFGVPAGAKAILVTVQARDSDSLNSASNIRFSPNNTAGSFSVNCNLRGLPSDIFVITGGIVPCNTDGDIYYQVVASGTLTLDCYLEIWGYWL